MWFYVGRVDYSKLARHFRKNTQPFYAPMAALNPPYKLFFPIDNLGFI
jgi:hypothetical protein